MNFNFPLLKPLRILLLPFALLAGVYITIRNFLYDKNILRSAGFNIPLISVGNLAVGGTGKSPMVEYLVRLLGTRYNLATLSRGYKRKTKGYALAGPDTTALEIGDEPMQFHAKFPHISVAVGEERIVAIPQLLHDRPNTEVIVLDDAFQHRPVQPGLSILLTEYQNLFTRDWFLPTGDLRDERRSAKRADIIVVTKCPADLSRGEKEKITEEISPLAHQKVFFTTIHYGTPYRILDRSEAELTPDTEILLVTGIANPRPLKQYLTEHSRAFWMMAYGDHHIFSIDDLKEIIKKFDTLSGPEKIVLTTEKDAVRLMKFGKELEGLPVYVIPVEHRFLFGEGEQFDAGILTFIKEFQATKTTP